MPSSSSSSPNLLRFSFSGNWSRPGVAPLFPPPKSFPSYFLSSVLVVVCHEGREGRERGREGGKGETNAHTKFIGSSLRGGKREDGRYSMGRAAGGRCLNAFLRLSLNDKSVPFLVILLDETVSVG